MNTKGKHLILAIAIAAFALLGNKLYLDSRLGYYMGRKKVLVMRASRHIRAGTPLSSRYVERVSVPAVYAPKASVYWSNKSLYLGQAVEVDVLKGDYILESFFKAKGVGGRTLSQQLAGGGLRAINLPVDEVNSLARSVVTGDRIDIVFTFNLPGLSQKMSTVLFQNVPVIATGRYSPASRGFGGKKGDGRYSSLTLQMSAGDAMRLNYARQVGLISIMLRSSKDDAVSDLPSIHGIADLLSASDREVVQSVLEEVKKRIPSEDKLREQFKKILDQRRAQRMMKGR